MSKNLSPLLFTSALSERDFRKRLRWLIFSPLVIFALATLILIGLVFFLLDTSNKVAKLDARLSHVRSLEKLMVDMETAVRGYQLTGDDRFLDPWHSAGQDYPEKMEGVLGTASAKELSVVDSEFRARIMEWEGWAGDALARRRLGSDTGAVDFNLRGRNLFTAVRDSAETLVSLSEIDRGRLLKRLELTEKSLWIVGSLALMLFMVGVALWLHRRLCDIKNVYKESLGVISGQVGELKVLLQSIGDAVVATDADGKVSFLNPVAEQLTGWTSDEAKGRALEEVFIIFNESTREVQENPVAQVLKEGLTIVLANHTVLRSRNGAEIPIEDSAAPIFDATGQIRGVILVFHDSSEKRRHEQALQASERLFRTVFNQQFQLMTVLTAEGRIREINDPPLKIAGIDRDEILGKFFWEAPWWDDLAETRAAWPERLRLALGQREPVLAEDQYRALNGDIRLAEVSVTVLKNEAAELEGFLIQANDVTPRRRAEKTLRDNERRLSFLNELADATRLVSDPSEIVRVVTRFLGEYLDVSHCSYADVEMDGDTVNVIYDYSNGDSPSTIGQHSLSFFGEKAVTSMREGITLQIDDVDLDLKIEDGAAAYNAIGIKSAISCPLVKGGRLRAIMSVHKSTPHQWSREEVQIVEEVVERSWAYIERMRSEEESRHTSERFQLATRATNDAIWDWNLVQNTVEWNEAITTLSGFELDEIPQTSRWWIEHIHPDDAGRVVEGIHHIIDQGGDHWSAEYRFLRRDGSFAYVLDRGYLLRTQSGKGIRMIGAMQDLSERSLAKKRLEEIAEQLQLSLDAASLGTWDFAPLTGSLQWDVRCKAMFGFPPDQFIDYDIFKKSLHPDDLESVDAAVQRALANVDEKFDCEYRVRVMDENHLQRWVRSTGRAFFNEEGQAVRFVGTLQDITAKKHSEDVLRQAKEQLEAASRAKDNFLAALSHELRTPLTPVLMTVSSLRDDEHLSEDVRGQLSMMQRNIELEARLIDDLLDLTRITQGKLPLRIQECDIHSLIGLAVEIVKDEAQNKRQTLEVELNAEKSGLASDPARMQQVFWNLLRNAVKFTPVGGKISIKTLNLSGGLCIEVADTGIGLAPNALQRIFQPFEQAGRENDHRFGGLGLGLAIANAIVDLHRGKIRAESEGQDCGSKFTVELPNAFQMLPQKDFASTQPKAAAPSELEEAKSRGLRLLVVEDHEPTLQVLTKLLTKAGHHVVSATSVNSGLAEAERGKFDVVVSDLGLPDGTGIELMEKLRAAHGLRGIALSGYGMEEDIQRSKAAGFQNHLTKPVNMNQLHQALEAFYA